jgi:putative addiction module component (TIGR02574 family)
MANTLPLPPPGFETLSADEKVRYVQDLWDLIAAEPSTVPVPAWHRQFIEERLADYRATPDEGDAWEQVRDELNRELTAPRAEQG